MKLRSHLVSGIKTAADLSWTRFGGRLAPIPMAVIFTVGLSAMPRQRVQSSTLLSVGYDRGKAVLELEFRRGAIYQYYQVPPGVYAALLSAPSKGTYFNAQIKGRFQYQRVR